MQSSRVGIYLKAIFAVAVWGASFIATKVALRDVSPYTVVWLRFVMGFLILGFFVFRRKQWVLPNGREWLYFAFLGLQGITFHQWLQSTGLVTAQAATTAWIVATTPVFIVILGVLFLKEKMGWLQIGGIVLAFLGVVLVVSKGSWAAMAGGKAISTGDMLVLISAPNWAVFSVVSRAGLKKHPAARMMFYVMGFGLFFCSILFFGGGHWNEIAQLTRQGWLGILFLGIFCSGLAYIFWYDALQELPASQLGVFLYVEPVIAVFVAALILGEAVLWTSLAGGAIILFGVWLVNRG